jgi:serine/threonine-protein kinase
MGVVWAAVHRVTNKRVALKFLKGPFGLRPELRRRFLREARAASAIVHPNVLEIHDVFELEDETPVMLMDCLEGETLGRRIERSGKLSLSDAADTLAQVVSGVGMAHAVGVVHRDLKPDNVFLVKSNSGPPSVRVLDFGIAKLMGTEGQAVETGIITGTGSMLGTPCYMSPEQTLGEKDIDHRTDIWSIGVMFYECLTGQRPVEGDSLGQVVRRLLSDGITPLAIVAPSLPGDITDLVDRMLRRERSERPQDLRAVQEVLLRHTTVRPPPFDPPIAERLARISEEPVQNHVVIDAGDADPIARTRREFAEDSQAAAPHSVSRSHRPRGKGLLAWIASAVSIATILAIVVARSISRDPADAPAVRPSALPQAASRPPPAKELEQPSRASNAPPSAESSSSAVVAHAAPKEDKAQARPRKDNTVALLASATSAPPASAASAPLPTPAPTDSVRPPHTSGVVQDVPF